MAQEVSKVDVYVDDKGNFVEGDNPNVALQLARKGVAIPVKFAARHGLNPDGSQVKKADKPAVPQAAKVEASKKPGLVIKPAHKVL